MRSRREDDKEFFLKYILIWIEIDLNVELNVIHMHRMDSESTTSSRKNFQKIVAFDI